MPLRRLAAFLFFAVCVSAQPFVYYRGVVNAGSYAVPGLPNSPIARGSMFSVFGRGLGPATGQQVSAFPLQTTFAGVSVAISQGNTTVAALPAFVIASQLNVIMPSNAPLGQASLRVTYNNQTSNPVPIVIADSSVGLFSVNGGGFGPGIVQNFLSASDIRLNTLAQTARPGGVEILWGTGLGAAPFPDSVAPTPMTIETDTKVYVGGKLANVVYAGRSGCCSSIDQIAFEVPTDAPAGCYVPVVVRTKGKIVSNTVTMAIDPNGAPCHDAHNPLSAQFRTGGKTALAMLGRQELRVERSDRTTYDITADAVLATFRDFAPSDLHFNAFTALPPVGTCTVYAGSTRRTLSSASPFAPVGPQIGVGSTVTVEGVGVSPVTMAAASGFEGSFMGLLGLQNPNAPPGPGPVLNNGPFAISAPGAGLISAFRQMLDRVTAVSWTNRDAIREVRRDTDLQLNWTGAPGANRAVLIIGLSSRNGFNATGGFACLASGTDTSFRVPSYVVSALPLSASGLTVDQAQISLVNIPLQSSGSIPGFDYSFLGVSAATSKTAVIVK